MKRLTILLLLLISQANIAKGDMCMSSIDADISDCDVIFVGKVLDIHYDVLWGTWGSRSVTNFQILRAYKGLRLFQLDLNDKCEQNYISVLSSYSSSTIGFRKDSIYLVCAYAVDKSSSLLWTNDCTCTDFLSKSASNVKYIEKKLSQGIAFLGDGLGFLEKKKRLEEYLNSISRHEIDSLKMLTFTLNEKNKELNENKKNLLKTGSVGLGIMILIFIMVIIFIRKYYKT